MAVVKVSRNFGKHTKCLKRTGKYRFGVQLSSTTPDFCENSGKWRTFSTKTSRKLCLFLMKIRTKKSGVVELYCKTDREEKIA